MQYGLGPGIAPQGTLGMSHHYADPENMGPITDDEVSGHHHHDHDHAHPRMPFGKFFVINGGWLAVILGLYYLIAPQSLSFEMRQPGSILLWMVLLGIPYSLFEYFYHRYLLHSAVLPFIGSMHRAHREHHGLTYVKAPVSKKEPEKMVPVDSEYPILHEHQEAHMMFPWYSLPIFQGIFLATLAVPLKLIFPGQPIVLALLLSVTLYYSFYELWHGVLHLPDEKVWIPLMKREDIVGKVVRHIYSFHLMHHWRPSSNVAIVGFWGFAIWDYVFRTHHRPTHIPLNGEEVNFKDADMKKPIWPVSQLDRLQGPLYKWSRRTEQKLRDTFLGKSKATNS